MLKFFCLCTTLINLLDRNYYDTPIWLEFTWATANLLFLLSKQSTKGFYFLSIGQICLSVLNMPAIGNHILFQTIVNLYLVTTWSVTWFREKKFPNFGDLTDKRIINDLRHLLLILYFFATFQKLNIDYLNPQNSCAGKMFGFVFDNTLPFLPKFNFPGWNTFLIYSSLIIEGLAPLMLLNNKLRKLGFILLLLLHLFLGSYIIDFNFLCISYLFLFFPFENIEKPFSILSRIWDKQTSYKKYFLIFIFFLLCLNFKFSFQTNFIFREWKIFFNLLLFLTLLVPVCLICKSILKNPSDKIIPISKSSILAWPFLCLLTLSSLGPYLGYKNITALAMYSNLRTEQSSNHLIIPKGSLQLFKEIDDVVSVPSAFLKKLNYQRVSFTLPKCNQPEVNISRYEMGRIIFYNQTSNRHSEDAFSLFINDPYFDGLREDYQNSSWIKKKLFGFRPTCRTEQVICSW